MVKFTIEQVFNPTDEQIRASADLFLDLMKEDRSVLSLLGGDLSLVSYMIGAMLRAGALEGEYYVATDEAGKLVGYTMWMPPGKQLFESEAQRNLGLHEFQNKLSDETKEYWQNTYMARYPGFVQEHLGPTAKADLWWLHQAFVRRDSQRQGVLRALFNVVLEKAKATGSTVGTTTTDDVNIAVYTSLGFKHIASTMIPSSVGEWPIHLFEMRTEEQK
ncbi:hypothetical protein CC1G_13788 [Coprinopsis cinerea okayama7|uniref:N-acetyltransferase domain-containing protein n=1 Tax=Coprinopsis cinerea (strain Okayama-7 / 130 / ATCC MYA-4618 / FGSC 9003) TaxID=240176 RepID=D6RK95_COPC7|nr:hypothetical protein CC1G_13788 [Coprinopsis cinerea okayama7\|eukprot:XP_002912256.1 hypothetical protein CC1G_13788 [Coprinopsis cinerea okayama7\